MNLQVLGFLIMYVCVGCFATVFVTRDARDPKGIWLIILFYPLGLVVWTWDKVVSLFGRFVDYVLRSASTWVNKK